MSCEFHLSRSELRELIESTGKLLQLPLSSQGGRSIPNRLLASKTGQRRLLVHHSDRSKSRKF